MRQKSRECMRLVSFNANGISDEGKRQVLIENFVNGRVDVLGVSETHVRGRGMSDGAGGMWEGVPGGVVWTGMDETYKGKSKEGCAIVMSERVWKV